jgi:hypothetical protein
VEATLLDAVRRWFHRLTAKGRFVRLWGLTTGDEFSRLLSTIILDFLEASSIEYTCRRMNPRDAKILRNALAVTLVHIAREHVERVVAASNRDQVFKNIDQSIQRWRAFQSDLFEPMAKSAPFALNTMWEPGAMGIGSPLASILLLPEFSGVPFEPKRLPGDRLRLHISAAHELKAFRESLPASDLGLGQ